MAPKAIFIGMPGAGKSAVGRRIAAHYGVDFADSDELIVKAEGRSISEIFAEQGEAEFRQIEARTILEALESFDGVLSLGGGAVLTQSTREALAGQCVIMIEADDAELVRRVTKSRTVRPLLQADPSGGIARLRAERGEIYHQIATHIVYSDQRGISRVVDAVIRKLENPMQRISITGADSYDVVVGVDLVADIVHLLTGAQHVLLVHAPDVSAYVGRVAEELTEAGVEHTCLELPRGEAAKDISTVVQAWDLAGQIGIGRDGAVLAIGGGATTDVAGFIAATWLRGVPVVHVPTTLLGMVDAAVGGKTGINTATGKNLVGSFYPPKAVLCDIEALRTLPVDDVRAGLGEVIKCGFISDTTILEILEHEGERLLDPANPALVDVICRAIAVKARVVSQDLKESGLREILNYGHTLAHAIEKVEKYQARHGEAVAIGCVFAAALAEASGIASAGFAAQHRSALATVGLPVSYTGSTRAELLHTMGSDKKVRGGELRFVVLSDFSEPQILRAPSAEALNYAFVQIGHA